MNAVRVTPAGRSGCKSWRTGGSPPVAAGSVKATISCPCFQARSSTVCAPKLGTESVGTGGGSSSFGLGGAASSSMIVPVPVAVPSTAFVGLRKVTMTVSSPSSTVSSVTETAMVRLVAPAANVSVPEVSAV